MSSKKFNPFKDFQSDQIQRSSRKIFIAHYTCRNADLNLTLVMRWANGFVFQKINSLMESWGVRLTWLDCKARGTHTPTHGLAITSRMRTAISHGQWKPCSGQLFRPCWGSSAWHSRRSVTRENPCGCFVFWRSKGRGAMPQGHENKGKKTIGQKEKQKKLG